MVAEIPCVVTVDTVANVLFEEDTKGYYIAHVRLFITYYFLHKITKLNVESDIK